MPDVLYKMAGTFFDGNTSTAKDCELWVFSDGRAQTHNLEGATDSRGDLIDYTTLKISSRLGNTPRYIHFPDGGKFETWDNASIDRWQQQFDSSRWMGVAHYLESHKCFVLIGIVVVLASLWGSVKFLIPVGSELIAEQLPRSVSQRLGEHTLELLDGHVFAPSRLEARRRQALQTLFKTYFADEIDTLGLALRFRSGGRVGANAFALPSGDLVFTDDLVKLAGDDLELLAVMAHEVGHIQHRHMLRRVIQDSFLVFILTMVTGDVSSISSAVVAAPAMILELAYSRDFEREADAFALVFMRWHRLERVHFSNMMQRLQWYEQFPCKRERDVEKPAGEPTPDPGKEREATMQDFLRQAGDFLSSHPAVVERTQAFGEPGITREAVVPRLVELCAEGAAQGKPST